MHNRNRLRRCGIRKGMRTPPRSWSRQHRGTLEKSHHALQDRHFRVSTPNPVSDFTIGSRAGAGTRIDGDPISSSSWDYAVNVHSVERRALRTPRNERRVTGVAPWRARCRVPRSRPRTDRSTAGAIRDCWCATAPAVTPDGCPRSRSWTRSASSSPDRSWSATRSPPGAACGPGSPCVVCTSWRGRHPPTPQTAHPSKDRGIPATNTARAPIAGAAASAP